MKKTKGVLLNLILNIAKAVPAMILAAAVFGMAAYVVCVNVIPLGYCAEAEFTALLPEGGDIAATLKSDGFYAEVADGYSELNGNLSPETAKLLFTVSEKGEDAFVITVRTASPEVSYDLMNTVIAVAEKSVSELGGEYSLTEADGIPTAMTRGDISGYVIIAMAVGVAAVFISALRKGLAFSAIESEKEFTRITDLKLLGTLPYSSQPLTRHKASKNVSE